MWWSDRRIFLAGALAAFAGCGFTPAYGPQGGGSALLNSIALPAPETPDAYVFNRRFEERLGRGTGPFALSMEIQRTTQGLGSLADGSTTRNRLVGRVFFALTETGSDVALIDGRTTAFTGYSVTGSTAATEAAKRDAEDRLMVILADQVIDRLLLDADKLPR